MIRADEALSLVDSRRLSYAPVETVTLIVVGAQEAQSLLPVGQSVDNVPFPSGLARRWSAALMILGDEHLYFARPTRPT